MAKARLSLSITKVSEGVRIQAGAHSRIFEVDENGHVRMVAGQDPAPRHIRGVMRLNAQRFFECEKENTKKNDAVRQQYVEAEKERATQVTDIRRSRKRGGKHIEFVDVEGNAIVLQFGKAKRSFTYSKNRVRLTDKSYNRRGYVPAPVFRAMCRAAMRHLKSLAAQGAVQLS